MGQLHIGIVGAGVGGLAAAVALRSHGHRVSVYEQASQFGRVGADINLTPNAVRALGPVTTRALAPQAMPDYCATRQERTARIQVGSRGNQWMKTQGNADWVYGYDAWKAPLATA